MPDVVGLAKALELALGEMKSNSERIGKLRDYFVENIEKKVPYVVYNGDRKQRLPQNANFAFEFIEGESLLLRLDMAGIACSSGSACTQRKTT